MCGIVGFSTKETNRNISSSDLLHLMTNEIYHRGPDDEGHFIDDFIALGMRRLSIIDLHSGKQPIMNENESIVIVFNGEIYNYQELRKELLLKGHIFKTNSDTETIVHAYEEYGYDCVNKLNGMFAFALWDKQNQKLFIARDRLGVKPLHYYYDGDRFAFGSEIKSILKDTSIKREIDLQALTSFLRFYYIPAPMTIFKNIKKLMPGHFMIFDFKGKQLDIRKYWDIEDKPVSNISYEDAKSTLRDKMFESVKYRMISEVPVGSFLSGGIDSTIVTGIMSKLSSEPINTFTIGYKDNKLFDESELAREVSKLHGTNHHELFLDFNDLDEVIHNIVWALDEPFADSSSIPTYYVSNMTKKHVTVALSGDGGDEFFAGYNKYTSAHYAQMLNKVPSPIIYLMRNLVGVLSVNGTSKLNSFSRMGKKFLKSYDSSPMKMHLKLMECFSPEQIQRIISNSKEIDNSLYIQEYFSHLNRDTVTNMMYTDMKFALPNDMLVKVDKMSMINSLEVRSPFLDVNVVEFAFQLPINYKMQGSERKKILKDTFADLIPNNILNAPKKGFGIPLGMWFNSELKTMVDKILSEANINRIGIFNYSEIKKIIQAHRSGKVDYSNHIWSLIVFHLWFEKYMV
ncbi:asparagine synthase (glutamine-hydrolyzing) [Lysinibacillus irui]|uniref:asparagine synthase (glutamine-hydrolyzing) n=1 Tax=Lysinibacillus irui TaxID=2998077 RepID=UPI003886A739